jgi:hypothetical protein
VVALNLSLLVFDLLIMLIGFAVILGARWVFKHISRPLLGNSKYITPRFESIYILLIRVTGLGALLAGLLMIIKDA